MRANRMMRLLASSVILGLLGSGTVLGQTPPNPELPPVEVRPNVGPQTEDFGPPYSTSGEYDPYGNPGLSWRSDELTSDSELVGPYGQPVWTTQRPFATTRAYVLPAGTYEVSQWIRPTWERGEKPKFRMLEELAIGLPGRFQLDIYERWNIEKDIDDNNNAHHEGVQIEGRWALADWGVLPLNPTIYAEWLERGGPQDKPNKYEIKLLLADQYFCDRLFFASNVILEQETADERETEIAWSCGFATPIIERKLMAGFETNLSATNVHGSRGDYEWSFMIGPSMQWRPTNRTFVDLVGLFGATEDSPEAQMYLIFGYQFGTRAAPFSGSISGPASTRGN